MRSSSLQFHLFTRKEAIAFLASGHTSAESYGDRVAAQRRLAPVTAAEERAAATAYNERAALERFQRLLREEWPEHGPIIVRGPR